MLETAHRAAIPISEAPSDLNRGNRFSLVLVRGDGARVLRFSFSRRLPTVVLTIAVLSATVLGVVAGDWWLSRARMREMSGLVQVIEAQRATISAFKGRMAEVQTEVATWRDLHARIWEPFGPDAAPKSRRTGI